MHVESVHVRKSGFQNPGIFCLWNPESGNVLLVEFGILGFGIRNTVQGIRNPTDDCNPESKFHWQNPVLGNRNPLLRIQNPQRPCWTFKGKSRVRWGRGWGRGKLACFLKPCLCSYIWYSYPTHIWNLHLKHAVLEIRDCDNLSLITYPI